MSGIIDMWNRELAKLRNKGEAEAVSSVKPRETSPVADADDHERSSTLRETFSLDLALHKLKRVLQCSEGSVSMLVESFCP